MEKKYGTVDKVHTLQVSARPLIRFSLNGVNCLIASHSLNFLAEVDEEMKLVATGYYNNRKQSVVRSYRVLGNSKLWQGMRKVYTQEKRSDKTKE